MSNRTRCCFSFLLFALCLPAASPIAAPPDGVAAQKIAVPRSIPESARGLRNPVEPTKDSLEYGKLIFSSQCTMCHGDRADGRGSLVERLNLPVPDFTDGATQSARTDGEMFFILTHGHGKMRGEGDRLDDQTKWNLINYIRSVRPRPSSASR